MKEFLSTKSQDMTAGQALIYVALVTLISFVPFIGCVIAEKVSERRRNRYYD